MPSLLGLSGSPRKGGNTDILVQTALKTATEKGIDKEFIRLADRNINPCRGCLNCKEDGNCIQNDDMQGLYELLNKAEYIVVGSPVYFATVSAQTKAFIDRLIALIDEDFQPRLPHGKRALLLFSQGDTNRDAYLYGLKPLTQTFKWLGVEVVGVFVAGGLNEVGEVISKQDILNEVKSLSEKLLK